MHHTRVGMAVTCVYMRYHHEVLVDLRGDQAEERSEFVLVGHYLRY